MARTTVVSGSGVAPGYGAVRARKPSPWAGAAQGTGGMGSAAALRTGLAANIAARAPGYSPPSATAPPSRPGFDINNLPVDPTYDALIGGYTKTESNSLAGLRASRETAKLSSGYSESGDPANPTLTFDPSNPNSVAAQMKKRYDESKTGNTNNYAARGQLYAGSLNNAQSATDSGYQKDSSDLQTRLISFLQQNTRDQGQAQTDFETNSGTAYGDRVARALSASSQNTSAPTSAPSGAGPSPLEQYRSQIAAGTSVKTQYTNAQGHPVRILANGTKQVSTDGGRTWRTA